MKSKIPESEMILNAGGSVYHLHLLPEDIADTIITVGDPTRVAAVSKYFDKIEFKQSNREFVTHTGKIGKKKITVISTGIGTDNIDIVLNELDMLANIDLKKRIINPKKKSLKIIRIGTSGGLRKELDVDSVVISEAAIGLDSMAHFYKYDFNKTEKINQQKFEKNFRLKNYVSLGSEKLIKQFSSLGKTGTTVTASGFYAPQGREIRFQLAFPDWVDNLQQFKTEKISPITNFEMETAGIYFLGNLLGHECVSISLIVANRAIKKFSKNYPKEMDNLIKNVLEKMSSI
jgi:uridine phosphorylase